MLDRYTLRQLKKFSLRLEWDKASQLWWFQKSSKRGKIRKTLPVHAENKDEAERAVIDYFLTLQRKSIVRHTSSDSPKESLS
jgi:hypothetical protein